MATAPTFILALLLLLPLTLAAPGGGKWNLLLSNIVDCTAHSVEYDVASNSIRPLNVLTDVWCSSGDSTTAIITLEFTNHAPTIPVTGKNLILSLRREDGTPPIIFCQMAGRLLLVVAGSLVMNFTRKRPELINHTICRSFRRLMIRGLRTISILFDYVNGVVVKNYPTIPGGDPRSYPSSGSAVLLPLREWQRGANMTAEVMVCGGAPKGSFTSANNRNFVGALNTCGRIRITDPNPQWVMETMPLARVMGDMVLLPNGNVLIINGASAGTAGWDLARNPVLTPLIYRPNNPNRLRFEVQNSSFISRMYHSTAILLRDGRILISGSNPHAYYNFTGVFFPTDLTMEIFSPDYLDSRLSRVRPTIVSPASQSQIGYGQQLTINFIAQGRINRGFITVTMVAPPFTTHAFSMNQRLLVLTNGNEISANVTSVGRLNYQVRVVTPSSNILAPPGYYLLFVVYREVPSQGIWVQIK
ncbi:hypothetical protein Pfo_031120 [Paulownia fortunei]|nr:hypothetical protein Pfo_031120 [Paulownia fortunei]